MLAPGSATGIMQPAISIPFSAEVAKSVDAVDSKSTVEIRAGSSPAFGTKNDCDNRKTYNNQYVVQ